MFFYFCFFVSPRVWMCFIGWESFVSNWVRSRPNRGKRQQRCNSAGFGWCFPVANRAGIAVWDQRLRRGGDWFARWKLQNQQTNKVPFLWWWQYSGHSLSLSLFFFLIIYKNTLFLLFIYFLFFVSKYPVFSYVQENSFRIYFYFCYVNFIQEKKIIYITFLRNILFLIFPIFSLVFFLFSNFWTLISFSVHPHCSSVFSLLLFFLTECDLGIFRK